MQRGATEPRQLVLGRARVSGPLFFVGSYGANREHLVFTLALAAHEIDAVETIFFDDMPVILDGSNNVIGVTQKEVFSISTTSATFTINQAAMAGTVTARAVYGTTLVTLGVSVAGTAITVSGATTAIGLCEIRYQPNPSPFVNAEIQTYVDFAGSSTTLTLSHTPIAGTVTAMEVVGSGVDAVYNPLTVTVIGTAATLSGGTGGSASITYQSYPSGGAFKARIRTYLGASGQTADAGMIAALPSLWTSAHTATGIAYLVVELDYDPTAFPGGIPNISAQIRGAKVYDPRTSTTTWSDNLALLARHYAIDPLGGRLTAAQVNDTSIIAAANVCDTSTGYVVNGQTYTRPLYKGGLSAKSSARPQDVLNDITAGMAGKWAFVDGLLRVKAGNYTTPVLTLDETWLHEGQQVHVQPKRARTDVVNVITASFADESQSYQIVQMPRIAPSTYITEDGTELPIDVQMGTVQFTGQAQHVAGCLLRDSRAGLTLSVLCNMRAYPLELFDVIYVNLARFGWVGKTFEVLDISWTLTGGIQLTLKETDATITAVSSSFPAFDPAKATRLPSPWNVANIVSLAAASGTAQLLRQKDGTIVSRVLLTWTAVTDQAVLSNGSIEIRYGLANIDPSLWRSIEVQGVDTSLYLDDVLDGGIYIIKARAKNALTSGQWCKLLNHQVIGKTALPVNVAGLAAVCVSATGDGSISWTPNAEIDYARTELRYGASYAAGTLIAARPSNPFVWPFPGAGTYTVWASHYDTSGNASATPASASVTITAGAMGSTANWPAVASRPANLAAITGAENLGLNLVSAANWVIGSSGDQTTGGGTQWTSNPVSATGSNTINYEHGPDGSMRALWYAISGTAAGTSPEGGIGSTSAIAIDNTKPYRFACWIFVTGPTDGSIYLGIGGNQVDDVPSGTINTNPYFHSFSRNLLTTNRWYLFTGHVLPASYSGAQPGMSGVYDGTTGQKVQTGTDFRWHAGITACTLRTFQYYTGGAGRYALFTGPRFDQLDGSEPSIAALIADAVLSRANTAYTNANAAQGDATAALTSLTNIASDSILSPSEKPSVVQDYSVITTEQSGIDAQATATGFAAPCASAKTAYDSAVTALTSYLGGLTGWNTVPGGDVAIVGTTFRSNFASVYSTKQALLNQIAATAATLASWANIAGQTNAPANNATVGATWGTNLTGQPTSLGGINSTEGTKLGGIAAGATVGATFGTDINGQATSADIAANAATYVTSTVVSSVSVLSTTVVNAASIGYTSPVNGVAQVTLSCVGSMTTNGSETWGGFGELTTSNIAGTSPTVVGWALLFFNSTSAVTADKRSTAITLQFPVTAGVAFTAYFACFTAAGALGSRAATVDNVNMRLEVIKR